MVGSWTPAGLIVTTTHYGPYGRLQQAHAAIRGWCAEQGCVPAGPSWEIYGHWQDDWNRDPSRISTEVFYLLVDDRRAIGEPGHEARCG